MITDAIVKATESLNSGPGISVSRLVEEANEAMGRVLLSKAAVSEAQRDLDLVAAPLEAKLLAAKSEHKQNHEAWVMALNRLKGRL